MIDFHNNVWLPGDPLGDRLVEDMDRLGIQRMLVHSCDVGIWSYTTGNEGTVAAIKRQPDRLVGTVCLDFRAGLAQCR